MEQPPAVEQVTPPLVEEIQIPAVLPPQTPAIVQAFLDAVAAIPAITPDNAKEAAAYIYGPAADAYEALLGTEYEERDDVREAAAAYAAAIEAVDASLELAGSIFAAVPPQPSDKELNELRVKISCVKENGSTNSQCFSLTQPLCRYKDNYTVSDVVPNPGVKYSSTTYPYMCTITLDTEAWKNTYAAKLAEQIGITRPHYVHSNTGTVTKDLYYSARYRAWYYEEPELMYVYVTETKPTATYRVAREYYLNGYKVATVTGGKNEGEVGETITGDVLAEENPKWCNYTVDGTKYTFAYTGDAASITLAPGENSITLRYEPFKVIYKDGVDEKVFKDQVYSDLQPGDETPEFNSSLIRDGYDFCGWKLTSVTLEDDTDEGVRETVCQEHAKYGEIIYTAIWKQEVATSYTVVHEYYTDGKPDGKTSKNFTGAAGQTIKAASIKKAETYEGNSYGYTSAKPDSIKLKEEASENVITLRYDRVSYTVVHEYYTDGELDGETRKDPSYGKIGDIIQDADKAPAFEGKTYVFETSNLPFTLTGNASENVITLRYSLFKAPAATYTVVHEYYTDGAKDGETRTENLTGNVGAVITAEELLKLETYEGNAYKYASADPGSITLAVDGENVITLRYNRAAYTVVHEYYTNGSLDTRNETRYTGEVGSAVDPADITRIPNGYRFTSIDPETVQTLTENGRLVITLRYDRTSGGGGGGGSTPSTPPEPSEPSGPAAPEIPDEELPLANIPEESIPEESVPLAEVPTQPEELELPVEPVPLANVPETGDIGTGWLAAMLAGALGLLWMGLTGKGRKHQEGEEA